MLPPLRPDERDKLVNREEEKDWLIRTLREGHHVHIYGIAGVGKTSLVNVVLGNPQDLDLDPKPTVFFYHITEKGLYMIEKREPVYPLKKPGEKPDRAIMVIDDFHQLTWFGAPRLDQIFKEIQDLKQKAERVQFVFISDLPVRQDESSEGPVLLLDWKEALGLEEPPVSYPMLPMGALLPPEQKTQKIKEWIENLRQDKARRKGKKELPPTWVLLESPSRLGAVYPGEREALEYAELPSRVTGGGVHPLWALRLPDSLEGASEEEIRKRMEEAIGKGGDPITAKWADMFLEDQGLMRPTRFFPGRASLPEVVLEEETLLFEEARAAFQGKESIEVEGGALTAKGAPLYIILNIGQRVYALFLFRKWRLRYRWFLTVLLQALLLSAFILPVALDPFGPFPWQTWDLDLSPSSRVLLHWAYLLAGYWALGYGYSSIFQNKPILDPKRKVIGPLLALAFSTFLAYLLIGPEGAGWSVFIALGWMAALAFILTLLGRLATILPPKARGWLGATFYYRFWELIERPDALLRLTAASWSGMWWFLLPLARAFGSQSLGQVPVFRLSWLTAFAVSMIGWITINRLGKIPRSPEIWNRVGKRYLATAFLFLLIVLSHREGATFLEHLYINLLFTAVTFALALLFRSSRKAYVV